MNLYQLDSNIEFKHLVHNPGTYKFKFEVLPFTVKGLDVMDDFSFEVIEKSDERQSIIKKIEEKDNKLKIEPSFFQSMIQTLVPTPEDNQELESDDEDANKTKENKDKEKKSKKVKEEQMDDVEVEEEVDTKLKKD